MHNPVMIGPRVYLRPVEMFDSLSLAAAQTRETDSFMDREREIVSPIAFQHWVKEVSKDEMPTVEIPLAVCLREDDMFIGVVSLDGIDWVHRTAETGSWFHESSYRNQGYGTEAKHLLIEYAFDQLQLKLLISRVFGPNWRSMSAISKQGYRYAGEQLYVDVKDGRFHGYHWHDLTREQWLPARERWREEQRTRGLEV